MSRSTSNVVWTMLAIIAAIVVIAGVFYGPKLYRAGRDLAGPIMDLAGAEDAIAALDEELPFSPPADGLVSEERLEDFLAVRRELEPRYREWEQLVREVEDRNAESLAEAKRVLEATRSVFAAQVDTLRARAMSPTEFRWLEEMVYHHWLEGIDDAVDPPGLISRVRELTAEDLAFLDQLEHNHGTSPAVRAMRERLQAREEGLESSPPPSVEGVAEANAELFWRHRAAIEALRLDGYSSLHSALRQGSADRIQVRVGDEGSNTKVVIE